MSSSVNKIILLGLLLSPALIDAQTLVGSGYKAPAPVSVAPGQIATFYVAGWSSVTGITATLQQQGGNASVPIQSVRMVSQCPNVTSTIESACGSLAAVTVQIPYELVTLTQSSGEPVSFTPAILLISQNSQAATAIELTPLADAVHVLTSCDVALGPPTPPQTNFTGLPCAPLVTHGDGSLVTPLSPAAVGEALTAWVFGLGQTTPAATTGKTADAAPTAETFNLGFDYEINALPTKPVPSSPDRVMLHPLYAGLSPGYVGLYQVNFIVPAQPPNGTPRCSLVGITLAADVVQSNFTVSIAGQNSFDGAGICVATQIPVD